jgi:hypothetical protein
MTDISNNDKIISVSDITARVDELHAERAEHDKATGTERGEDGEICWAAITEDGEPLPGSWEAENTDEAEELARLEKLLDDLRGRGTSHDWGGDTYPDALIAEYHFAEYAEDMAHDMGAVSRDASWIVIDWEATANGLKQDYRSVDFDGSEYWHRA